MPFLHYTLQFGPRVTYALLFGPRVTYALPILFLYQNGHWWHTNLEVCGIFNDVRQLRKTNINSQIPGLPEAHNKKMSYNKLLV